MTVSNRNLSLFAVIASMVVVNLVYGLTLPLLSLVLDAQGMSKTIIGTSIVAQAVAGVVIAPYVPKLIVRIGAARIMRFATLLAALALIAIGLTQNVWAWYPLRFILGAAAAVLWSASEVVINEMADDDWRGRIIGIYGSAGAAGFALGPLILIATGTDGLLPYIVPAALIFAAGLPLLWLRDANNDEPHHEDHMRLGRIFRLVPHIMLLNLTYAAVIEAFIAFFPLYGLNIGLTAARTLSLLTIFALGGVFLQLPLGWLADHVPRRKLLLFCVVGTAIGFVLLPWFIALPVGGPVFAFSLGGIEGMIYAMGVILLGQRFRGAELAAASVLYTTCWAAGTMIGPAAVGIAMDVLGDLSLPYLAAVFYTLYLPVYLVYWRRDK